MLCVECLKLRDREIEGRYLLDELRTAEFIFHGVSYCESHATAAIRNEAERFHVQYADRIESAP